MGIVKAKNILLEVVIIQIVSAGEIMHVASGLGRFWAKNKITAEMKLSKVIFLNTKLALY